MNDLTLIQWLLVPTADNREAERLFGESVRRDLEPVSLLGRKQREEQNQLLRVKLKRGLHRDIL
jgi:hypothetical protein